METLESTHVLLLLPPLCMWFSIWVWPKWGYLNPNLLTFVFCHLAALAGIGTHTCFILTLVLALGPLSSPFPFPFPWWWYYHWPTNWPLASMQHITGCHSCEPQTVCSPINDTSTMVAAIAATVGTQAANSPLPEPQTMVTRTTTTTMGGML